MLRARRAPFAVGLAAVVACTTMTTLGDGSG